MMISTCIIAQDQPFKIYDSGGLFHQYQGKNMLEHQGEIYVLGSIIDTNVVAGQELEENFHMTVFDLDGVLQRFITYDNEDCDGETISIRDIKYHIYEDALIIPYSSGHIDCVPSIGTGLDGEWSVLICDEQQADSRTRRIISSVLDGDVLTTLHRNPSNADYSISRLDLSDPQAFIFKKFIPELPSVLPLELFQEDDGNLLIAGPIGDFSSEDKAEHVIGMFMTRMDKDLNVISTQIVEGDYFGSSALIHGLHDEDDGTYVTSGSRMDRAGYEQEPNSIITAYAVLMKLDPNSSEPIWEIPVDTTEFRRNYPHVWDIILSAESDGYIFVGEGSEPGRPGSLLYGKVSKQGEMLWKREIYDALGPNSLNGFSVIATSDGHYMLTGTRSDVTDGDGYDTRAQLILMKFDEDGDVIQLRTDTYEAESMPFAIVPNPAQDRIMIVTDIEGEKQIYLSDMNGQAVQMVACDTLDCDLDTSGLVTGTYVILVADREGNLLGKEQLVIQR